MTKLYFRTKRFSSLTDSELTLCSELYSNHYGKYSGADDRSKTGKRIRMGVGMYKKLYQASPDILMSFDRKRFDAFMEFSDSQLLEAYSRMNMPAQDWTKGTSSEIDFILGKIHVDSKYRILDLGCGQGRHCLELAKKGYTNVIGIDFSESNIAKANNSARTENLPAIFINADARSFKTGIKSDLVLCLYDVIGSFTYDSTTGKGYVRSSMAGGPTVSVNAALATDSYLDVTVKLIVSASVDTLFQGTLKKVDE